MSRSPLARLAASLLAGGLLLALQGCGGGSSPAPGECTAAAQCPQPGGCRRATCLAGACGVAPLEAGTVVGPGVAGDCLHQVCDGAGAVIAAPDDADLPDDGNACTVDACAAGSPSHTPAAPGASCAQDGGVTCDGAGACVQCLAAADCPGADGECATRTCSAAGACGVTYAPEGTPLAAQAAGDCLEAICGPAGTTTTRPLDAGAACSGPGGGVVCDAAGACVQCRVAADCPGADGPCAQRSCAAGTCGVALVDAGTLVGDPVAGDCRADRCDGAGNATSQAQDADVPVDGLACTLDVCVGGVPSNPPAQLDSVCGDGGGVYCDGAGACVECNRPDQCASGVCQGRACQAATCVDLVRNGAETDVDCGGGTCPACATGQACRLGADCASLVCGVTGCLPPSCGDTVRNGTETDVDCGGPSCAGCAVGRACLLDRDCGSGVCVGGVCGPPRVTGTTPADGATDVAPGTGVTLSFSAPVTSASVTPQAAAGPCAGTVQLSTDDFATCLGVSGKLTASGSRSVTVQPLLPLDGVGPVKVRTVGGPSTSSQGEVLPFASAAGFTVASSGGCGSALVVSQVYPGGGQAGASYASDFVELHNRSGSTVSLSGLSVQTGGAATTWTVTPLAGAVPPGGYFLVQLAGSGSVGAALPTPDASGAAGLDPAGGKVALASSTAALGALCPTVGVLDLVGWGPTPCFEGPGAAAAPAPPDAGAALVRLGAGCADGNGSAADLAAQLVQPRSSASARVACGCSGTAVNETDLSVEMDFCSIQAPASLGGTPGAAVGPVWGRVYEAGVTEPAGAPAGITAQVGFGPQDTDPRYATGWTFVPAGFQGQVGNEDEFVATLVAPAAGAYRYVYRFSPDGQRWTYCDPDGAGSGAALGFEPNALPTMTIVP